MAVKGKGQEFYLKLNQLVNFGQCVTCNRSMRVFLLWRGCGIHGGRRKNQKTEWDIWQIWETPRDVAMGCFCEEKQLHKSLYMHRKQFQSLAFSGFQSSRKRFWSKNSQWHVTQWQFSHGKHMWTMTSHKRLLIFQEIMEYIPFMTNVTPFLNEIRPMINALWS